MIELSLPILWYTEEQQKLVDAGLDDDLDVSDCKTKEHKFYRIDAIRAYDKNHTTIFAGYDNFVARKKYEEVKQLIKDQMVFKFN